MASPVIQIRIPDRLVERIDEARGSMKRPDFIRRAVEAYLGGRVSVSPREGDKELLLKVFGGKRLTSRQAKQVTGWLGLRYDKAEAELLAEGKIGFVDGVVVVK